MNQYDTHSCPSCGSDRYGVKDSRPAKLGEATVTRRRRSCSRCGHRESTLEIPEGLVKIADLAELMRELNE